MELEGLGSGLNDEIQREPNQAEKDVSNPLLGMDLNPRSKTSLRMHYEAQVSVIQGQVGNLEKIRLSLGLSQRKMSQLLLVDPSSWTRWTKNEDSAPPHIWRALQWYLALREKIPGLTNEYFLAQNPQVLHRKALKELEIEREERIENWNLLAAQIEKSRLSNETLQDEVSRLKKDVRFHRFLSASLLVISLFWAALMFWKGL